MAWLSINILSALNLAVVHLQVLYLSGANRPGLLTALSAALRDLSLEVSKAVVETDAQNNKVADKFYVTKRGGGKVTSQEEVANIKRVLEVLLRGRAGPATPRPKFTTQSIQQDENKRELLYTLMGELLRPTGGKGASMRVLSLRPGPVCLCCTAHNLCISQWAATALVAVAACFTAHTPHCFGSCWSALACRHIPQE